MNKNHSSQKEEDCDGGCVSNSCLLCTVRVEVVQTWGSKDKKVEVYQCLNNVYWQIPVYTSNDSLEKEKPSDPNMSLKVGLEDHWM